MYLTLKALVKYGILGSNFQPFFNWAVWYEVQYTKISTSPSTAVDKYYCKILEQIACLQFFFSM